MDRQTLHDLLTEIDRLVSDYQEAAATIETKTLFPAEDDVEEIIKHGGFPPSDPRSTSGKALFSIARKLKEDGGNARLASVLAAYRQQYGPKRAAILNARWHYLAEQ